MKRFPILTWFVMTLTLLVQTGNAMSVNPKDCDSMQVTGFNNEPVATNSDAHAHHGMQIKADGAIEPSLNDDCCAEGCNCVLMCSSYAVTSETLASVPLIFSDMATTLSVSATDLYLPKQKRPPKSLI